MTAKTATVEDFLAALRHTKPGDVAKLVVDRGAEGGTVEITLGTLAQQ